MKKMLFLLSVLFTKNLPAQYKPVDHGSVVAFKVTNFGFDVSGSFTGGLQGVITFDPQNVAASSLDVSIDAATINTDNTLRDSHLREEGYFDVKNYPRIRLVSTKVTSKNGGYLFTGQLTMKGKSKEISFPFTAAGGTEGYVFKGSFVINRKDFGIGGTSTISNELTVSLTVATAKQ